MREGLTMKKSPTFLEKKEAKLLLRQPDRRSLIGSRDYAILKLMLFLGLRKSEVSNLSRGNFVEEEGGFLVFIKGKGNREETLPIEDRNLILALRRYWKRANIPDEPETPAFFTFPHSRENPRTGITPSVIRDIVEKYSKMAGFTKRITPHSCRHSAITNFWRTKRDLLATQRFARHKNIDTTRLYLHLEEGRVRKIMKDFSYGA